MQVRVAMLMHIRKLLVSWSCCCLLLLLLLLLLQPVWIKAKYNQDRVIRTKLVIECIAIIRVYHSGLDAGWLMESKNKVYYM